MKTKSTKPSTRVPFHNNKGNVMQLDAKLTIADLVKKGMRAIRIEPAGSPLPDGWWCSGEPLVKHAGDCSIWIGPICDCGELRKAASAGQPVEKQWAMHLAAIECQRRFFNRNDVPFGPSEQHFP